MNHDTLFPLSILIDFTQEAHEIGRRQAISDAIERVDALTFGVGLGWPKGKWVELSEVIAAIKGEQP
jgi:hypothetical protein